MTQVHALLDAELAGDQATIFGAIELALPGRTVRLLDGSAEITFGGATFTGENAVFGSLAALDEISDGAGDEAPGLTITLYPAEDAEPNELANAEMQGARVRFWLGARNDATGLPIGDPLLLFDGEVDVPTFVIDQGTRSVEFDCVGGMERFFEAEEGIRLAPAFHKRVWPGELGLDFVTGVADTVYWGQNAPSGVKA